MNTIKLVYICSPLRGDIERNIAKAVGYCRFASIQGVIPLAPHIIFTQFLNDEISEERKLGLQLGLELLKYCQELWAFGGWITEGMLGEIESAKRLSIPCQYYSDQCERSENTHEP
ncbi:MAG: DUF4406 domain-containing protein [Desulfosporosinus sp.]|nr:DUF4406 domain-containing protein [Desulfosporosinus sp.]